MRRLNRFAAEVRLSSGIAIAHVPDPGRLTELLFPGNEILVIPPRKAGGRTSCAILAARLRDSWIPTNTTFHNRIAEAMLQKGLFVPIPGSLRREVTLPGFKSRFDFLVNGDTVVEVKGCTLSIGDTGLFPDAPTARGARQVREISRHVRRGGGGMVLFLVMVPWARRAAINAATDPVFAEALDQARMAGTHVHAAVISLSPPGFSFKGMIPFTGRFDYRNTIVEPGGDPCSKAETRPRSWR